MSKQSVHFKLTSVSGSIRWFAGTWKVQSQTMNVVAPGGVLLFGGNNTYQAARNEIGSTISYESRFVAQGDSGTIADREFNVKVRI
jgi:hypothetical protein